MLTREGCMLNCQGNCFQNSYVCATLPTPQLIATHRPNPHIQILNQLSGNEIPDISTS